ncbi:aquaporin [Cumulibacter manganitolerans]|uniref:aquaporin n=1 Tax=Cumulibacter manganitolerans TaxID=1884992 RepID=UPI001295926A|nr:aquaporin [Cumulibacter manganitolerans]
MNAVRSYVAEFIGTAVLMIGGVGTAVLAGHNVGPVGVALGFGLTLIFLVYAIGPISGCHVNPAVTLGLLVTGKIALLDAVAYVIAQLLGAIAGAAVIFGIAQGNPSYSRAADGLAANGWGTHSPEGFSMSSAFGTEVALTFLLVFVVLAATDRIGTAALAGLAIGVTMTVCYLVGIPVDGASVNPARSLGSAVLAGGGSLGQLWLFLVAPAIGGVVGALVYNLVFGQDPVGYEGELNVDGRPDGDPLDRTPGTRDDLVAGHADRAGRPEPGPGVV